jgi:integrase
MLKLDLVAAGIEYQTEEGVADFHALRHTFGTLLARSGVLPQEAQRLMRHSDINLTMGIYTHLRLWDMAKAVDRLPVLQPKAKRAKTGTADVPEEIDPLFDRKPR